MDTGSYVDPSAGKTRFGDFAEEWLAAQTFDETMRAAVTSRYENHIGPRFEKMQVRQIKPSTVQAWLKGLEPELAPGTRRATLSILNAILGAATEDGLIAKNPCASRSVSTPAPTRERVIPWTVEQLEDVVAAHAPEWRAVPIVGAGLGLRQGEMFRLVPEDVGFLRRRVLVRHQAQRGKPPKGHKEREIPLPDVVSVALAEHVRATAPAATVFHRDGELVDAQVYTRTVWKPALVEAGLEPTQRNGMHVLRHTYASMQLEHGTSIRALAEYLGHHDPGFTLRTYTHLMPASEDRARAAIDDALGRDLGVAESRS